MELETKTLKGDVKVCLTLMDNEIRFGLNKQLLDKFRLLRQDIRGSSGAEVSCLNYSGSEIIEIDGMMFWVNCRQREGGTIHVFASCKRSSL